MKSLALMTTIAMAGFAATAMAGDERKPDSPRLAAYERTGETRDCLSARRIRSARILNDHQILFEMYGGKDYLNEPSCAGLRKNRALSYRLTNDSLCSLTIVDVLDTASPMPLMGACGLKTFQELKKKETASN